MIFAFVNFNFCISCFRLLFPIFTHILYSNYFSDEKRLGNLKKRGVLLKEGQTLKSLYEERVPLYEKYADIVVDEEGKDLEASLQALLETLQTGVIK